VDGLPIRRPLQAGFLSAIIRQLDQPLPSRFAIQMSLLLSRAILSAPPMMGMAGIGTRVSAGRSVGTSVCVGSRVGISVWMGSERELGWVKRWRGQWPEQQPVPRLQPGNHSFLGWPIEQWVRRLPESQGRRNAFLATEHSITCHGD